MYRKFDVTENFFLYSVFLEELNTAWDTRGKPICFAKKSGVKLLFTDLLREKNIVSTEKTSWKYGL
jgi:hypothetical protein